MKGKPNRTAFLITLVVGSATALAFRVPNGSSRSGSRSLSAIACRPIPPADRGSKSPRSSASAPSYGVRR
jgi:hypothetical protein